MTGSSLTLQEKSLRISDQAAVQCAVKPVCAVAPYDCCASPTGQRCTSDCVQAYAENDCKNSTEKVHAKTKSHDDPCDSHLQAAMDK